MNMDIDILQKRHDQAYEAIQKRMGWDDLIMNSYVSPGIWEGQDIEYKHTQNLLRSEALLNTSLMRTNKALESALADERTTKTVLEEKLRVATEALEKCSAFIPCKQCDATEACKEALAKIRAPSIWNNKTTEQIQESLERSE
jgi:hypothetical protein